ncbi:uncharacterized protein [Macrobrachium rosenbergii]|uniref:uncharacterized protein n=1 Tax=Macrobrachium rosenbergii TaxID=79674 RepID=UPI0034D705C1
MRRSAQPQLNFIRAGAHRPDVSSTHDSILKALDSTLASQQELSRRALLPPINLEVFDGDMTKFSMFRNAFLWVVESNSDDPARRLTHLHNSLRGPPKNLIEMCLHMPPSEGYEEAWRLLCHKYEDDDDLTEAYLKRLFAWKEISPTDSQGLEDYASYLSKVKAALGSDYIRLELHETIRKIIDKLPHPVKIRWITKGDEHKYKLPALINYLRKQARITKQMQYFDCRPKTNNERRNRPVTNKTLPVHSTQPSGGKRCLHCDKTGHDIEKCYVFGRLSVNDRWDSVTSKRMCFKCLQTMNHTYGNCKEAPNCSKCGVDSHHTLLHKEHKPASTQRASAPTREKKNVSGGGNQTGASKTESATTPNPEQNLPLPSTRHQLPGRSDHAEDRASADQRHACNLCLHRQWLSSDAGHERAG